MFKKLLLVLLFALIIPTAASLSQQFYTDYTLFLDPQKDPIDPNTKQPIEDLPALYPDIAYTFSRQTAEGYEISAVLASNSANFAGGFSVYFPDTGIRGFGWLIQNGVIVQKGEQVNNQPVPNTDQLIDISDDQLIYTLTLADKPASFGVFVCDFSDVARLICDEDHPFTNGDPTTYQQIPDEARQTVPSIQINIVNTSFIREYRIGDMVDCATVKPELLEVIRDETMTAAIIVLDNGERYLQIQMSEAIHEVINAQRISTGFRIPLYSVDANGEALHGYAVEAAHLGDWFGGGFIGGRVGENGTVSKSINDVLIGSLLIPIDPEEEDIIVGSPPAPMDNAPAFFPPDANCPATADVM